MQKNFNKFIIYLAFKSLKDFVKGVFNFLLNKLEITYYKLLKLSDIDKKFIAFNNTNSSFLKTHQRETAEVIADIYPEEDLWPTYSLCLNYFNQTYKVKFKPYVFSNTKIKPRTFLAYKSFCPDFEILRIKFPFSLSLLKELKVELNKIKTKQDLINYSYHDINIGIDIYESYLRDLNRETIDLNDINFYFYFYLGIAIAQYWENYLTKHHVKAIFTSHDNYIWFNILCKLGYKNKILVIWPHPLKIHSITHPFSHFEIFSKYSEQFNSFSDEQKREGLNTGKEILESRFSGKIGPETYYLNKSLYGSAIEVSTPELNDNSKPKILIATHCFFDNPHAYGRILFPDFWEWLIFLGEISKSTDYLWFIKAHPDPTPGTTDVIKKFLKKYPNFTVLPNLIPHSQVINANFSALLTCYGTIGEEYPLFNIPVINAGMNPRISYDFNFSPKSVSEYESLIRKIPELKQNFRINPEKVYEFIYMHRCKSGYKDLVYSNYLSLSQNREKSEGPMLSDFLRTISPEKIAIIFQMLDKII